MARQTHPLGPGAASGAPVDEGGRARPGYPLRGDPRVGAANEAPTAPHATAPAPGAARPGGPARFWEPRRVRIALAVGLALSLAFHVGIWPWEVSLDTGIALQDVEGELAIPVDLLEGEEPPPPKQEPPPKEEPPPATDPEGAPSKRSDAGPPPKRPVADAGPPLALADDAGDGRVLSDGGAAQPEDASAAEVVAVEAASDAGAGDAGGALVASVDAGEGASGPRDPAAMLGAKSLVAAGTVNVALRVNVARIRQHPMAPRIGRLLVRLPQWRDFLRGAPASVDPIRDTDDILIYGPSLIKTEKTLVIVRYGNVSDAVVDGAIEGIARAYDRGGPFDAGVPGVKASLGHADDAERVFMRPQKGVLVVLPRADAARLAPQLVKTDFSKKVAPHEAMRLTVKEPWRQISIRGLRFSTKLSELRMWIVPDATNEVDVFVEGDCADEEAAVEVAADLTTTVQNVNQVGFRAGFVNITVSTLTRGLLDGVKVEASGKRVATRIHATTEQLEAIYNILDQQLGGGAPPP